LKKKSIPAACMAKSKSIKERQSVDAAESNAGDDFHILWSVRKGLELLNFDEEGLKAVTIEGLDNEDNSVVDSTGDLLLGVDITEYYGGEKFIDASRVIISQLKYSTRRADIEWTASKVTTDSKGSKKGSVIGRLSVLFAGLIKEFGESAVLKRLTIKLVSNRPASKLLFSTIQAAKDYLKNNPNAPTLSKLKLNLNPNQQDELEKILLASGLKGKTFLSFLEVLDFSDCGSESRLYQKQEIVKAVSNLGSSQALTEYAQLKELIWAKMMPEQKQFNKITKEDILYKFGISDIDDLFPVPAKFEASKNSVLREQLTGITEQILSVDNNLICIHAGAGLGKSTIVRQIENTLPKDSICILFDCYGNGAYDDPADKRHTHQRALLQICNELALKIGTPLLLAVDGTGDYYIREFKRRLSEASAILHKVNPLAILAVIIDASDNSVSASVKYQEKCFLHDIVQMELPPACKLIVTTRTQRLDTLGLPEEYGDILLEAFSLQETSQLLQPFFNDLTEESIKKFWRYTKATPRIMTNAIKLPGESIEDKMAFLKPNGKTLEELFKISIKEATKRSGDVKAVNAFLKYLSLLPSPVPVAYLKDLALLTNFFLEDVATDLWNGVVYENGKLSFRDEDFETFVRTKYLLKQSDYDCAARYLLGRAKDDEYASTHLGLILSRSDKRAELVPIVLERKYLLFPKDPVKNREAFVERTKLAMQFCEPGSIDFLKIQMVAAEAAKTNKALEDILVTRADLASAYGNIQTNQKIYFQSGNPEWFGSAHFRSAAILSRNKETIEIAKKHLMQARKWRDYRATLSHEERAEFRLDTSDLANGAEAVLRITEDLEECIDWITNWRPKRLLFKVSDTLVNSVMSDQLLVQRIDLSVIHHLRVDIQLLIAKNFIEINQSFPFAVDEILLRLPILKKSKAKFSIELIECIVCFAEYLLSINHQSDEIGDWLTLCAIEKPERVPYFYSGHDREENLALDLYLRKVVMLCILEQREVTIEELYPQKLIDALSNEKIKDKQAYERDEKEFGQVYRHLLPVYQNRIKGILKTTDKNELNKSLKEALDKLNRDYEFTYRQANRMSDINLFMASKLLDVAFYNYENVISTIRTGYSIKHKSNIRLYMSIAWKLCRKPIFYPQVLAHLDEIDKLIPQSSLPASEQIEYYSELAIISSRISKADGKYYFDKMVEASNEIDLEAHEQIKCINYIVGENEFFSNPKLAVSYARYIEYCWNRLSGWDHFPWREGVRGISRLDNASAFAIICQWDHRGIREGDRHFLKILELALRSQYLGPELAGGLFPMNETFWEDLLVVAKLIIAGFDQVGNHKGKNNFVRTFIRESKLKCTSERTVFLLRELLELIENGRYLNAETVEGFRDYCLQLEQLVRKDEKEVAPSTTKNRKDDLEEKYKLLIKDKELIDADVLGDVISKAGKLRENGYVDLEMLFTLIENEIPDDKCGEYLTEFIKLDADLIDYYPFTNILANALNRWGSFNQVKSWKTKIFEKIVRNRFLSYYEHDYFASGALKKLAEIFDISDIRLAGILRSIIPEYVGELSANALYQLFYLTARDLKKEDKAVLLEWTLEQWNEKIQDPVFENILIDPYKEHDQEQTIAFFIRYHLGHPDKRVRWKAVHSVRRLINIGNRRVLMDLLKMQNDKNCRPFQNSDYPFYWISAKLFLWVAIERICWESPDAMSEYAQGFYEELFNMELPHTQIQYFIRRSCLVLSSHKEDVFSEEQKRCLESFFESKLKPGKKKARSLERKNSKSSLKTRFKFDSLDTLPYWYAPLGRLFRLSSNEVAQIADKYIAEYWGYGEEVRGINHVKDASWELTSNRHGSAPTIENLQTYLEYHAMFCTASELLKTTPLVTRDDGSESFGEWLDGWGKTWDQYWLSDFRDPIPLQKKYWDESRNEEEWEWNFSLDDFEEAIGLKNPHHPGYLVVRGGATVHYGKDYESQYIASALVNPKTAKSLLRTLHAAKKYDYAFPFEGEDDDDDEQPRSDDFAMKGWVKDFNRHREGIDDTDELFYEIEKRRLVPSRELADFFQLSCSEDFRFSFNKDGNKFSILETWNSTPKDIDRHYGLFTSGGSMLYFKIDALLDFLKSKNMAVILQCEFSRRPEKKGYQEEYYYYKQLFIIYPDGSIKTLSRDYRIG
jgi:hypothetical protein